jgi:hypothetical protein
MTRQRKEKGGDGLHRHGQKERMVLPIHRLCFFFGGEMSTCYTDIFSFSDLLSVKVLESGRRPTGGYVSVWRDELCVADML